MLHDYPDDDITAGIWLYLRARYPDNEAEERRARLRLVLHVLRNKKRLRNVAGLHDALLRAVRTWEQHAEQQWQNDAVRKREADVVRARRDVDRAIASVCRVVGPHFAESEMLLSVRDALEPLPLRRSKRGRPWEHVTQLHADLRALRVPVEERKEICDALGFTSPSDNKGWVTSRDP